MPLWVGGLVVWARALKSVQAAIPTAAHEVVTLSDAAIGLSSIVMVYLLKVVVRTEKNVASLMQRMDGTKDEPGIAGNVRKLLEGQEIHGRALEKVDDNFRRVNDYVTSNTVRISAVERDMEGVQRQVQQCPVHREESPMKGQRTHD